MDSETSGGDAGPHVLHVIDRAAAARLGRMARQVLIGLSDAGVRVSLATDDAALAHEAEPATQTQAVFESFESWWLAPLSWRMSRAFEDAPPDFIHIWEARQASRVSEWARRREVGLLVHAFSSEDVRMLVSAGRHPDRHVAGASKRICAALREKRPTSHYPIQYFGPAILAPEVSRKARRAGHVTGILSVYDEASEAAGAKVLMLALARLAHERMRFQAVLIAGRESEEGVRSAVRESGLQEHVSMIAGAGMWDAAIGGADVFVVSAPAARVSVAPLLAMASGKAVIAARGQMCDRFVEGETCLMFRAEDDAELAAAMRRTMTGEGAAGRIGESARAYAEQRCRVSELTGELARFYAQVCFPRRTLRLQAPSARSV